MSSHPFLSPRASVPVCSPIPAECAAAPHLADRSLLRKLELHGPAGPLGMATRDAGGAWSCPVTPARTLLLGGDGPIAEGAVDVTCAHAALELTGPRSDELLARFCALDVRPAVLPVGGFRPGSVARTPGYVLRTGAESLLVLVGWALGEYLYDVVAEAVRSVYA